MTNLVYDYESAIPHVTTNPASKVLPFKREKIDYKDLKQRKELVTNFKQLKTPDDVLKGKKLRRQINREDDNMILEIMLKAKL